MPRYVGLTTSFRFCAKSLPGLKFRLGLVLGLGFVLRLWHEPEARILRNRVLILSLVTGREDL